MNNYPECCIWEAAYAEEERGANSGSSRRKPVNRKTIIWKQRTINQQTNNPCIGAGNLKFKKKKKSPLEIIENDCVRNYLAIACNRV